MHIFLPSFEGSQLLVTGMKAPTAASFRFPLSSEHCLSVAVCWDVLHQPYLRPTLAKWEIQGNGASNFCTTLHQARVCPAQERRKYLQNKFFSISLSKCYLHPAPLPSLFYWSILPHSGFPSKQNTFPQGSRNEIKLYLQLNLVLFQIWLVVRAELILYNWNFLTPPSCCWKLEMLLGQLLHTWVLQNPLIPFHASCSAFVRKGWSWGPHKHWEAARTGDAHRSRKSGVQPQIKSKSRPLFCPQHWLMVWT